jgi:NitT/TauT family transport system substrate-binding protein
MRRTTFVTLAAAATAAAPRIAFAQAAATVRIGTFPAESYGLAIIAREQGFFERNGIDAQISYIGTASGGITPAVVGGALEVGCISMGPTSNAHLRGIPVRLIAPGGIITSEAPTTELVVLKSSPVTSAKDLNGKTLGTSTLSDVIAVAQLKFIDVGGGNSKSVKFVELPPTEAVAAMQAGRIDSYPMSEPFLTNTRDQMRSLGALYDCISRRTMISMHIAMEDWLQKNTAVARRFVLAMRQAAQWANAPANRSAEGTIIANASKIPLEVVAKMHHVVYGETLDVPAIQPQVDTLAEYKVIERRYNVADIIWRG